MAKITLLKRALHTAFLALFAIAIVISLLQFSALDKRVNARYSAIHLYDTPDLMELGRRESPHFRDRYGPAIALNEISPDATLIAFRREPSVRNDGFRLTMLSAGRVKKIERIDRNLPPSIKNFDYTPYIVATGDGGRRGRAFAIAAANPPSKRFFVIRIEGRDILIDEALVPDATPSRGR